jgi:hypothetical protein
MKTPGILLALLAPCWALCFAQTSLYVYDGGVCFCTCSGGAAGTAPACAYACPTP